jgi:hypothetical protein
MISDFTAGAKRRIWVLQRNLGGDGMRFGVWETLLLVSIFGGVLMIPFEKTRWGKNIGVACGAMMFLLIVGSGVHDYLRGHWRFNAYLVPVAIVGPDGNYPDGTPASLYDRTIPPGGAVDTAATWGLYAMCVLVPASIVWLAKRDVRRDQQRARERAARKRRSEELHRHIGERNIPALIEHCRRAEHECPPGETRDEFVRMREELERLCRQRGWPR